MSWSQGYRLLASLRKTCRSTGLPKGIQFSGFKGMYFVLMGKKEKHWKYLMIVRQKITYFYEMKTIAKKGFSVLKSYLGETQSAAVQIGGDFSCF